MRSLRHIPLRHRLVRLLACTAAAIATSAFALPRHSPVPGGLAVMELSAASGSPPAASFNEVPQPVLRHRGKWVALVGIPLATSAGRHVLDVDSGKGRSQLGFEVRAKRYPTQRLRIPDERMVKPPPELAARIEAEAQRIESLKRHFTPAPEPDTAFALPAAGPLSSRFGVQRVLNGEPRSPHAGLDLAVAVGAPLRAPAAGKVLAVEDFYFAGRTVVIDHGQGLLTLYAHLSRVDAVPGQVLQRGETFGASGVSGRITGPHLHWVVIVGGTAVDPELFLPPGQR